MKYFTVTIELQATDDAPVTEQEVNFLVSNCLAYRVPENISYRVMEVVSAPYGPLDPPKNLGRQ